MIYNYITAVSIGVLAIVVIIVVVYILGRVFGIWHGPLRAEELRDIAEYGCTAEGCPGEVTCRSAIAYGVLCGQDAIYAQALWAKWRLRVETDKDHCTPKLRPGHRHDISGDLRAAIELDAELTRKQAFDTPYPLTHEAVDVEDMTLRLTHPGAYADDWAETTAFRGTSWADDQAAKRSAFRREMGLDAD